MLNKRLNRLGLIDQRRGSYILLLKLPEAQTITIGSMTDAHFPRGYYAYVGSALGGIKSRLSRHLKSNKKLHWHIDYLLQKASITDIIISETEDRVECSIAQALSSQFDSIPGFGSSDCKCRSHLFLAFDEMKTTLLAILNRLNMRWSSNLAPCPLPLAKGKGDKGGWGYPIET